MSAALRRAFELLEANEPYAKARLGQIGVAERDRGPVVDRLFDYFGGAHQADDHPFKVAMDVALRVGESGGDDDVEPLLTALKELPGGQLGTLYTIIDLACAHAAVEGMVLGVSYVEHEAIGQAARRRTRPRR
jgi:hypothetical protein